jgi:hypothetical protein
MAVYIIPIFCFGLVITGIVFLGIQEASELAKRLAQHPHEAPSGSNNPPALSGRGSAPARPLASKIQP